MFVQITFEKNLQIKFLQIFYLKYFKNASCKVFF